MDDILTDKVQNGYLPTYIQIAMELGDEARVLELGVDRGHSLVLWQRLFYDGEIWGVDNNPDAVWPTGTHRVTCDQTSPHLEVALGDRTFDLIVDDASHAGAPTTRSFQMLWPRVKPGGYYVIEDWGVAFPDNAPIYDNGMLQSMYGLLHLFDTRQGPLKVESLTFKPGLAIVKRRR